MEELIDYAGFSTWAQRGVTMVALLYIRWWDKPVHSGAIRVPTALPIIFLIVCISLVSVTVAQNFKTASYSLMMLGTALLIYTLFLWEKTLSRFRVYRTCSHWINRKVFITVCYTEL